MEEHTSPDEYDAGTAPQNWLRAAALEEKKALDEVRANVLAEHSHMFRWLSASLLALNGGGAIALLSTDKVSLIPKLTAGGTFLLGIAAALLIAVFTQRNTQQTLPKAQKLLGYWLMVAIDAQRDEEAEKDLLNDLQSANASGVWSRRCGWASALFFFVGSLSIGWGLVDFEPSEDQAVKVSFEVGK